MYESYSVPRVELSCEFFFQESKLHVTKGITCKTFSSVNSFFKKCSVVGLLAVKYAVFVKIFSILSASSDITAKK